MASAASLSCIVPTRTLRPTSPALPWLAWASLPHVPRDAATRRRPPGRRRGLRLVARAPIPWVRRTCVVSPEGSWAGRSAQTTPGLWGTRSPHAGMRLQETEGSPTCPRSPGAAMPRSQPPLVAGALALPPPGLLPSSHWTPSASPHVTRFGAPSRGLPPRDTRLRTALAREARGCAPARWARRSSGRVGPDAGSPAGEQQPVA